jgi:hypothetical protein
VCTTALFLGDTTLIQSLLSMSSLGSKTKALIKRNRKKFEAANQLLNQASSSKRQKGNEEAPLHPPRAPEDPYRIITQSELPTERNLNRRKHNNVFFLGKSADGQAIYQQTGLSTHQPPQSTTDSIDTSNNPPQPATDSFLDFDYGFDSMDYRMPQDDHPILQQQGNTHFIKDRQSRHSRRRYGAAHRWNADVLPSLIRPYMALRAATNSGRDHIPAPTETTLCSCGEHNVRLEITCVYLKRMSSDLMIENYILISIFLQVWMWLYCTSANVCQRPSNSYDVDSFRVLQCFPNSPLSSICLSLLRGSL